MKGSYPRNISIIAAVFIFLILFLALANLYISIQFKQRFTDYDKDKITTLCQLCANYMTHDFDGRQRNNMFKDITALFQLDHLIITDTLGNRLYDSHMLPFDMSTTRKKVDFTGYFENLPEPDKIVRNVAGQYLYFNQEPPIYIYMNTTSSFSRLFERVFAWHIFYITLSLLFIGFLGIFLIRNLFLPMRYVARLAKDMGVAMKKEDFVPAAFNEMYNKMKIKEQALIEFSSFIAHEFRNSIAAIIGLVRLVEKGKKPAADVIAECQIMENLIKRLVDYAQPLKIIALNTDIAQLINEAVTKAKTPKRITIELHIEKALPRIPVDNELLLTALTNLLQNSIQAIKNKGRIDIRAEKNENHVVIMVIDNGSGMDKKTLENIFSPFYSETEQGMGLGLAYVKKIIDAHNGKISVESKKGKGSKFVVALPMST